MITKPIDVRLTEECKSLGISTLDLHYREALAYAADVESHYGQTLVTEDWITVINSYSRSGLVLV